MLPKPSFQTKSRRLPEVEAVTIAIGIRFSGGALIGADMEYTHGDSLKTNRRKTILLYYKENVAAVGFAGSVPFARMFLEQLEQSLADLIDTSKRAFRTHFSNQLLEFYEKYIFKHPRYQYAGGPDFNLICAVWSVFDGLDFFWTNETAVNEIEDYQCIGAGEYLCRYIIEEKFQPLAPIAMVKDLATNAIRVAKNRVPYCGGGTQLVIIGAEEKREILFRD